MKSNKHIVIITPGFPENESDEKCIPPLQQFVKNISERNNDLSFSVITTHYPYYRKEYRWNRINIYCCKGKNLIFPLRFLVWGKTVNYFKKIKRNSKVDLIHSFWLGECALIGQRLSRKYNLPHVNTLMGQELEKRNKYLKFINLNKIHVVAISNLQSKIFNKVTGRDVDEIISWGINESDRITSQNERTIDLLTVGSLTLLKNHELFVKIVNRLKQNHPDIKAVIIGSGSEKEKLKKLIASFSLKENIKLTCELNRLEVLRYMSKSRILLHTSSYESFGYVFAEALLNGMYIVSLNVGAAEPSERWIVAKDENDMIQNIEKLLSISLNHQPVNLFPLQRTVDKYTQLYNRVISQ